MQIDIDTKAIQSLLNAAGITGFTGHYSSLGGGEGNDTFVLDHPEVKLILRVAKYGQSNNLTNEARALHLLNLKQVPRLVYFDRSKTINGRSWIIETYVTGVQVERLNLQQLESLGTLLANVHHAQSQASVKLDFWKEFLTTCQSFGNEQSLLNHPDNTLRKLIHESREYFQSQKLDAITPSLIHGDVSLNNMLVNNDTVSLIDWEFSRFTDPMADFSTLFYEDMAYNKGKWRMHITRKEKAALFAGYAKAGGTIDEQRLKVWHNFDKLGGAAYLYWKLNHSNHIVTPVQAAQYTDDLDKLATSLEQNL